MHIQLLSWYLSVISRSLPHQYSKFLDHLVETLLVSFVHVLWSFSCAIQRQNSVLMIALVLRLMLRLALRLLRQELALGVDVLAHEVHHAFLLLLGSEVPLEQAALSHHSDEWRARRLG